MRNSYNVILSSYFFILAQVPPIILSNQASLGIVYNSKDKYDGPFQDSLFRGTFLGLMEADRDSTLNPIFLDLGTENMTEGIWKMLNSNSRTIVSLLGPLELQLFISQFGKQRGNDLGSTPTGVTAIFTPRTLSYHNFNLSQMETNRFRILSLQPNDKVRAAVILNRIVKVQTRVLTPILDDPSQLPLLGIYKSLASDQFPKVIRFKTPVFLSLAKTMKNGNQSHHPHLLGTSSTFLQPRPKRDVNTTRIDTGILLLSSKWLPEARDVFWSEDHFFRWFSHNPIQEIKTGFKVLFGMYTVQYVGSTNWDTRLRRNVIQELGNFSDPSPNVLSVLLAFDAALVAASHARLGHVPSPLFGMTGEIKFDSDGFRDGDAICQGISALSPQQSPYAMLLQNSSWILEDSLRIRRNKNTEFNLTDYQVATSSIVSPGPLIQFAKENMTDNPNNCPNTRLEVMTRDPFNQHPYRYFFGPENFPLTLLVPNQFGYGLKIFCKTKTEEKIMVEIACTSDGSSTVAPSVHCFQARIRERRSPFDSAGRRVHNSFLGNQREDNTNSLSYDVHPPPVSAPMNPYMGSFYAGNNNSDITMTTSTEAATEAPAPPPPKLPDLRGILKGVLPFVGACIGAATGCSVCVVVLGRLPLGALPAVCTGPCFVTTFSNCGGLLGRTFAETTVVCTELFRQGRLDMETFLVDAEFGQWLAKDSVHTLKGYQKLASPIVSKMKTSETLTNIVELFARPWAQQMMYLMGRSTSFNWVGFLIHHFGMTLCSAVGRLDAMLEDSSLDFTYGTLLGGIILMIILLMRKTKVMGN